MSGDQLADAATEPRRVRSTTDLTVNTMKKSTIGTTAIVAEPDVLA